MSRTFKIPPRACRYCGVTTSDPSDPRVGFACCEKAIEDQLRWRQEELDRLRKDAERELSNVKRLEETATGSRSDDAIAWARRARARFDERIEHVYTPRADELKAELAKYETLRAGGQPDEPEAPEYPRPYRED